MSPNDTPPVDPGAILATIVAGIGAAIGAANWSKIAEFLGRLLTALSGKRSTREHPAANGSALTATNFESLIALVKSQGERIDNLEADNEALMESCKALGRKDQEIAESWRSEFRDFKIQNTIDTGRSIAKRTSEIESDIAKQATEVQVAQLDAQHYSNAILSAIEIMTAKTTTSLDTQQEQFNEMIVMFKAFIERVDRVLPHDPLPVAPPAILVPPSADLIALKQEQAKHQTEEIKPVDIKPDDFRPVKPEDGTPPDEAA